jgi:hypothetical protein
MPNVTISLDEEILKASREYASRHGMSLNALVRKMLESRVVRGDTDWLDACFALMDKAAVDSGGRSWKREDLYDV